MAEIWGEEKTGKDWAKILLPRILRAVVWGLLMGGEILLTLYVPEIGEAFKFFPIGRTDLTSFLLLFVGFEVAIQLLAGTVFPYALRTARALISIILLVTMTNWGLMTITIQSTPEIPLPSGMSIIFSMDFKPVLGAFLLLSLLSIVKNMLQAMEFTAGKEEASQ